MVDLLANTLDYIVKISLSRTGYLLKVGEDDLEILTLAGEEYDFLDKINRSVQKIHTSGSIDQSNEDLFPFNNLSDDHILKSFFIQKISENKFDNSAIYVILLSEEKENYNSSNFKNIYSYLETIKDQLKESEIFIGDKNSPEPTEYIEESAENILPEVGFGESYLSDLLEISGDMIFILDRHGCLQSMNKTGYELLEYEKEDIIGKHFIDFVDPFDRKRVTAAFKQILNSNERVGFEIKLDGKFGKALIFEITAKKIIRGNKISGLIGIGKNLTKTKKLLKELDDLRNKSSEIELLLSIERSRKKKSDLFLEELDHVKREFISGISHEFRTPLASIIGFSEAITSDPKMPDELKAEFSKIILDESKRLARLINQVFEISRIEAGKIQLDLQMLNAAEFINDFVHSNRKRFKARKIELHHQVPSEEILIEADREKLTQVFNNLLNFSIFLTPEGGRVSVIGNNFFNEFEVIITDTGQGIPEEEIPHIFQNYNSSRAHHNKPPSLEIGLVFAKKVIDLHKGMISLKSQLNKGCSFIIKLPKIVNVK